MQCCKYNSSTSESPFLIYRFTKSHPSCKDKEAPRSGFDRHRPLQSSPAVGIGDLSGAARQEGTHQHMLEFTQLQRVRAGPWKTGTGPCHCLRGVANGLRAGVSACVWAAEVFAEATVRSWLQEPPLPVEAGSPRGEGVKHRVSWRQQEVGFRG